MDPLKPFRLTPDDVERYTRLRRQMLETDPWSFSASPDDDKGLDKEHLTDALGREDYAICGVEIGGELVAAAGIMRARRQKHRHRCEISGVYVVPEHRGRGLGRAVVSLAIELARGWSGVDYVDLGVSERASAARQLYESLGFVQWGREP